MDQDLVLFGIDVTQLAAKLALLAFVILVAIIVDRLTTRGLRRLLDASSVPSASIFVNILRVIIWSVALSCVAQPVFGIEPTGVIAALGVTSLVISFGMQDTVSNIVGGLGLMIGRVVKPGDTIRVNSDFTGRVIDTTWRSTTVRDRLGNEQIIPNSVLTKTAFTKLSAVQAGECALSIAVAHDADLSEVSNQISEVIPRALAGHQMPGVESTIRFTGTTAYGITCDVFLHVDEEISFAVARDLVMRELSCRPWFASAL